MVKTNRFGGLMQVLQQESAALEVPESNSTESETTPEMSPVVLWVPHHKIHRDPEQDRRYFDSDELSNMARSMESVGNIDPLSVRQRPGSDDEYDLLAGEKRHRAGKIAKLEKMLVRVFDVDDRTADDIKAISNLQRGDLNKWEETRTLMRMLCRHLEKDQEDVVRLLNQAANQKRGLTSNVVREEDWEIVEDVFKLAGRLTPESFRKHRLPLLKLPAPIQTALQQGKLHYTKVNEILRVKQPEQQDQLLEEAISNGLSVDDIQAKIKDLQKNLQTSSERPVELPARLTTVTRQIKQSKVWQDPKKQKKLEKLLSQLEELLEVE